jgi:hypothetical protein
MRREREKQILGRRENGTDPDCDYCYIFDNQDLLVQSTRRAIQGGLLGYRSSSLRCVIEKKTRAHAYTTGL